MTFDARNSFCSRLTSAICLFAQVQFHAKYPLIGSQSDREFTFSYAILCIIGETAEKSQVILGAACGKETEIITVHQNLVFFKTACSEGRLCD